MTRVYRITSVVLSLALIALSFNALMPTAHAAAGPQVFSNTVGGSRTTTGTINLMQIGNNGGLNFPTSAAGTFANLRAYVSNAPGTGNSWTVRVRDSAVNTSMTCVISDANTSCSDTTNTYSNDAGDGVDVTFTPSGTVASSNLYFTIEWTPNNSGETMLLTNPDANTSADRWAGIANQTQQSVEASAIAYFPAGGTLKNLYGKLSGAIGAGTSYDFAVKQNGATTTLTCNIANPATTCNDTSNTVSLSAGDKVIIATHPNSSPTSRGAGAGTTYVPTNAGDFLWVTNTGNYGVGTLRYATPSAISAISPDEATTTAYAEDMTITGMNVYASAALAGGVSVQFDLRKNLTDVIATCTMTAGNTTCTPGALSLAIAQGDRLSYAITPSSAPSRIFTIVTTANANTVDSSTPHVPAKHQINAQIVIMGRTELN